MIYLNKCFFKVEPNIEFLVVFSGRLGVRLMMTNKKLGEG